MLYMYLMFIIVKLIFITPGHLLSFILTVISLYVLGDDCGKCVVGESD